MVKSMAWEYMSLIAELTQGKELTSQLMKILHSSHHEEREFLLEKIQSSYAKALSMLNCVEEDGHTTSSMPNSTPSSFANLSPTSEVAAEDCSQKVAVKKRKTLPSWNKQVKMFTGTVFDGLDDGHSWRKYGQKNILGAKFPRGYFRCTHRKQGCLATKQVQRSDADPTMLEVTYQGRHTCNRLTNFNKTTSSTVSKGFGRIEKQRQKPQIEETKKEQEETIGENYEFPFFDFPSPTYEEENIFTETNLGGNFMGCFSPMFMSPTSSESSAFSLPPFDTAIGQTLPTSESGITEIVSEPTSVNNSPTFQFDFSLDKVDFDSSFSFDTSEHFC